MIPTLPTHMTLTLQSVLVVTRAGTGEVDSSWSRSPPCSSGGRLLSSPRHPALGGSNPEVWRVQDTSTTALSKRLLERDGVHYYPGPEAPAQSSSVTFSDNGDTITSHHIDHHIDTIVGKGTEEDISGHLPLDLVEQPTSFDRVALSKFRASSACLLRWRRWRRPHQWGRTRGKPLPRTRLWRRRQRVVESWRWPARCDIAGDKLRLRRCRFLL